MRIIAGEFRSRSLLSPKGEQTRPTTDRARETLFNVLGNLIDMEDVRILDLFAGSGALGFEALSRGAEHVTFVEEHRNGIAALKANAEALKVIDSVQIAAQDVYKYISAAGSEFDLIFADASYDDLRAREELPALLLPRLSRNGIAAVEHRTGTNVVVPELATLLRVLKAGEASFTLIQRTERVTS